MLGYILRRLAATIPVMLLVAVFVFLMLRLTPGDPAAIIAGDNANAEQVAAIAPDQAGGKLRCVPRKRALAGFGAATRGLPA